MSGPKVMNQDLGDFGIVTIMQLKIKIKIKMTA